MYENSKQIFGKRKEVKEEEDDERKDEEDEDENEIRGTEGRR